MSDPHKSCTGMKALDLQTNFRNAKPERFPTVSRKRPFF